MGFVKVARALGCLLSGGTLREGNVTCPCHGSVFNVLTGAVVKGPAKNSEPAYGLRIEEDQVLIDV